MASVCLASSFVFHFLCWDAWDSLLSCSTLYNIKIWLVEKASFPSAGSIQNN